MIVPVNDIQQVFMRLVASRPIDEVEEGFLFIVETHPDGRFREWAALCAKICRGVRQLELELDHE